MVLIFKSLEEKNWEISWQEVTKRKKLGREIGKKYEKLGREVSKEMS